MRDPCRFRINIQFRLIKAIASFGSNQRKIARFNKCFNPHIHPLKNTFKFNWNRKCRCTACHMIPHCLLLPFILFDFRRHTRKLSWSFSITPLYLYEICMNHPNRIKIRKFANYTVKRSTFRPTYSIVRHEKRSYGKKKVCFTSTFDSVQLEKTNTFFLFLSNHIQSANAVRRCHRCAKLDEKKKVLAPKVKDKSDFWRLKWIEIEWNVANH